MAIFDDTGECIACLAERRPAKHMGLAEAWLGGLAYSHSLAVTPGLRLPLCGPHGDMLALYLKNTDPMNAGGLRTIELLGPEKGN